MNKSYLKRLKEKTDAQLILTAKAFKCENRINSSKNFQRNYDTVLFELGKRGLLK